MADVGFGSRRLFPESASDGVRGLVRSARDSVESISNWPARRRSYLLCGARASIHSDHARVHLHRDLPDIFFDELDRLDIPARRNDARDGSPPSADHRRGCSTRRSAHLARSGRTRDFYHLLHLQSDRADRLTWDSIVMY